MCERQIYFLKAAVVTVRSLYSRLVSTTEARKTNSADVSTTPGTFGTSLSVSLFLCLLRFLRPLSHSARNSYTGHHGYKTEDIVILTDDSRNPRQQPTKRNILDAMRWLVRSARTHDSLLFHCVSICSVAQNFELMQFWLWKDSGHGGQTKDLDGDEVDGYDEGLLDFPKPLYSV